jgi:sec-independent protein translocase protein TatA
MYNSIVLFLNIGGQESIIIIFAILLLFGGKKLPELARGLGKGIREFKDASDDVKREIHRNINSVQESLKDTPETKTEVAATAETAAGQEPVVPYQQEYNSEQLSYGHDQYDYDQYGQGTYDQAAYDQEQIVVKEEVVPVAKKTKTNKKAKKSDQGTNA